MQGTDRRYRCHPFESQILIAVCDEVVPQAKPAECDGGMICVLHVGGEGVGSDLADAPPALR